MSATCQQFTFHGAFKKKIDAQRKERKVKGAFIRRAIINGKVRFLVLKPR